MAILYPGMPCALCGAAIDLAQQRPFATSAWCAPGHEMDRYSDTAMHWDCYARWPDRPRFAAAYVGAMSVREMRDPFMAKVLANDDVVVMLLIGGPEMEVRVNLVATASCLQVRLDAWQAWIGMELASHDCAHPVEREALGHALPDLRAALPSAEAIRSRVDWDDKQSLAQRRTHEEVQRQQAAQDAVLAHNQDCAELDRARPSCPRCGHADSRFLDGGAERKSYWICKACARSFRKDDLPGRR